MRLRLPVLFACAALAPTVYASLNAPAAVLDSIHARLDSGLAAERRLYWLHCTQAVAAQRKGRVAALWGYGFFLSTVPVEVALSGYNALHPAPTSLLLPSLLLCGGALWNWQRAWGYDMEYRRYRACCRYWQELAGRAYEDEGGYGTGLSPSPP